MKVGIIGVSGYTGGELLRFLSHHPHVSVEVVTSRAWSGNKLVDLVPWAKYVGDIRVENFDPAKTPYQADLFLVSLPHTSSLEVVAAILNAGRRVIDLSADYRFRNPHTYAQVYDHPHSYPELTSEAVYGLPEFKEKMISGARLVANPGCFPTGALLGLIPGLKKGLFDLSDLVVDAKTGVSGAGKDPSPRTHFPRMNDSVEAYQVGCHRHRPEIVQEAEEAAGKPVKIAFTPHLIPMNRGLLTTIYARPAGTADEEGLRSVCHEAYKDSPFVSLLPPGIWPTTAQVRGTNFGFLNLSWDKDSGHYIIVTAIDNLGKGASGQAIQNMNLMAGFPQETGLMIPPLEI